MRRRGGPGSRHVRRTPRPLRGGEVAKRQGIGLRDGDQRSWGRWRLRHVWRHLGLRAGVLVVVVVWLCVAAGYAVYTLSRFGSGGVATAKLVERGRADHWQFPTSDGRVIDFYEVTPFWWFDAEGDTEAVVYDPRAPERTALVRRRQVEEAAGDLLAAVLIGFVGWRYLARRWHRSRNAAEFWRSGEPDRSP